jgi:tRNA(Ile)-lysidine synthase
MMRDELMVAIGGVPGGGYAIGVSGGADSVALLHLVHHHRREVRVHVVHLDHETRGGESERDAAFVRELAERWGLPHTVARRSEVERRLSAVPENKSARFRAARHQLFREAIEANGLRGVLLAHHADDQAETVMHRLLRGARAPYLAGMGKVTRVKGMAILRPLLDVPGAALREYLSSAGQGWREDASNVSREYSRNRLRDVIGRHGPMRQALLDLDEGMRGLREWARGAAPRLGERFVARALQGQPAMLAAEAARRWLVSRGVSPDKISPGMAERLVAMATDAASPPRQTFAEGIQVRRRRGEIRVESG